MLVFCHVTFWCPLLPLGSARWLVLVRGVSATVVQAEAWKGSLCWARSYPLPPPREGSARTSLLMMGGGAGYPRALPCPANRRWSPGHGVGSSYLVSACGCARGCPAPGTPGEVPHFTCRFIVIKEQSGRRRACHP